MDLLDVLEIRPVTVVYIKNQYLRKIDGIAKRLNKMGAKILKKSSNNGMIFLSPRLKRFKSENIMLMEEVWKIEIWD